MEERTNRFRYQSHADSLKDVHLPSALTVFQSEQEISENGSHFQEALERWKQLNLAPSFLDFVHQVEPMCASMPLLLHNWNEIIRLWLSLVKESEVEGLTPLFDLLQRMAHDLRMTLSPVYTEVFTALTNFMPRTLPAPVLTALLSTLQSLFKYLLIPSVDLQLLEKTWGLLLDAIPKCHLEVQRAVAEVWASVLRRLKSSARECAVKLIAQTLRDDIGDFCAWIFIYACQSVSQTLHTATPSILSPLISTYLQQGDDGEVFLTLLRRVITSLTHHVKDAERFSVLSELLTHTVSQPENIKSSDEDRACRSMQLIIIPCSVRRGSRMTATQLATLLSHFPSIPFTTTTQTLLLRFIASILTAGDMSLWVNAGRQTLEHVWSSLPVAFAVQLSGLLAEMGWGGWKQIALPMFLRGSIKTPSDMQVLATTAHLCRSGMIDVEQGVNVVWKKYVEEQVLQKLELWARVAPSPDLKMEIRDVFTLAEYFPSACGSMLRILSSALEEDRQGHSPILIASCLDCLCKHDQKHWANVPDVGELVEKVCAQWPSEPEVLAGLVTFAQKAKSDKKGTRGSATSAPAFNTIYSHLQGAILSHQRPLRLNALTLLSLSSAEPGSSATSTHEVIQKCLQGEEVALDVQGVRERVLRIGRISVAIKDDDDIGLDCALRWLVAQFKVNLRPLWSPATDALSSICHRPGAVDAVWRLLFSELVAASVHAPPLASDDADVSTAGAFEDVYEDERSWRDPSAHKFRVASSKWDDLKLFQQFEQSQMSTERLDKRSYEHQLLSALCEFPNIAEKHNREFVPHFLSLLNSDTKLSRPRLISYLTVFSKFSNPKALWSTQTLLDLYHSLLSHPDRPTRTLALSCYMSYKPSQLVQHDKKLRTLLDETRWRDELVAFLDEEAEDEVNDVDRPVLVDIVIRLLFGLMVEHKGRSRGRDRRATVLATVGGFKDTELKTLVELMLVPFKRSALDHAETTMETEDEQAAATSDKQRVGFLTLLGDVMKSMGSKLLPYWPALLETVIDLTSDAQRKLPTRLSASDATVVAAEDADIDVEPDHPVEDDDDQIDEDGDQETVGASPKTLRHIRQLGLKRLADFLKSPIESFDFRPFMAKAFPLFISPRLDEFPQENAQGPSSLLNLFWCIASRIQYTPYLVEYNDQTLPQIYQCLVIKGVKTETLSRVFDIIDRILTYSEEDEEIARRVVQPHTGVLLDCLTRLAEQRKLDTGALNAVGQRQIAVLSRVAKYCNDEGQCSALVSLLSPLLRKPSKLVPEKIKVDLLRTLTDLLPGMPSLAVPGSESFAKVFDILCRLFQSLILRAGRVALISAFRTLSSIEPSLNDVVTRLDSLNSYSSKRMDEPDFIRRLDAYNELNETAYSTLSAKQWLPLLYHVLHDIHDPTELAVRTNAAYTMRRFIDVLSAIDPPTDHHANFSRVLYPGLKSGLRSGHELVRTEILGVIAYAVGHYTHMDSLKDMVPLLASGDEEAGFFTNIHHVQVHRRTRALRRLAEYCGEGRLRSGILTDIFVPVVSHYITSTGKVDHHLVNEAIQTMGKIGGKLAWGAYYSLIQKYIKLSSQKRESERAYARTLVAILENFHFPMEEAVSMTSDDQADEEEDDDREENENGDQPTPVHQVPTNATPVKQISDAVTMRLLPSLLRHLEKYDANTEDITRIPIAAGVVRVVQHLPQATRQTQINRLLTVMSQILRSKSQETRDLTRDTLSKIATILGPAHLPDMIRELKLALTRGPQLHVLAYIVHALLVHFTSSGQLPTPPVLDSCAGDIAYVSAEVIFGESGKDVQSEGFKTKMREVRTSASKGLDSFAITAQHVTPSHISALLLPLKAILRQTEASKSVQLVDEVLKRIAGGLNSNPHLTPAELLVLCHTLITQNAKFLKEAPRSKAKSDKRDAIVQLKRNPAGEVDHYAANSYRFVAFGLDLLHTALRRNRFNFHDASIISRLDSMVVAVGNTLYSSSTPVLTLGLKAAAGLVKCPLKTLDKSLPIFITQILEILKRAGSTEPEFVQVAFKSLATMLRDGPPIQVKEKDLIFLLELLTPDLEEPQRQSSVFTILRAIVSRKFVAVEIYDIMEKVSDIMVTSQSTAVQEMCRGVLLQFLLDYPQGKGRLRKQMSFLAQNLSYVYESGRRSVMELLSAVLSKFQPALIREYADMLFVALVMSLANEDSGKCKEMAAHLIKMLAGRLEPQQIQELMSHLQTWSTQTTQPKLTWVSSQVYGLMIDGLGDQLKDYVPSITANLETTLARSSQDVQSAEESDDNSMEVEFEWQIPYYTLVVYSKMLASIPSHVTSDSLPWSGVVAHLLYPHAWVRTAACRLIGTLFSSVPAQAPQHALEASHPLSPLGMQTVAQKLCLQLKSPHLDEALGLQIVKNLFYLGKCFSFADAEEAISGDDDGEEEGDDEKGETLRPQPLPWLFSKLSYQIRSAHVAKLNRKSNQANWTQQPMSILQIFAAMASFLEPTILEKFLIHLLTPIYRLTDDSTIRDQRMEELKVLAIEVQDLVQNKVGISKFSAVYSQIRQGAEDARRERRVGQGIQATVDPAAAARRRSSKAIVKKESKKRKNRAFAESAGRSKRHRAGS